MTPSDESKAATPSRNVADHAEATAKVFKDLLAHFPPMPNDLSFAATFIAPMLSNAERGMFAAIERYHRTYHEPLFSPPLTAAELAPHTVKERYPEVSIKHHRLPVSHVMIDEFDFADHTIRAGVAEAWTGGALLPAPAGQAAKVFASFMEKPQPALGKVAVPASFNAKPIDDKNRAARRRAAKQRYRHA